MFKTTKPYLKIAIVAAVIMFAIVMPLFVRSPYTLDLIIIAIVNAVLAMTFIMMLRTGLISMGLVAFWGVGAYTSIVLVMKLHLSFWLSLPLSGIITGLIAAALGFILIGSGTSGFAFVLLSSVVGMLFTVVIGNISYLGGYTGVRNIPPPNSFKIPFLPQVVFNSKVEYFYLVLALLLLIIIVSKAFYAAWTGRAWRAIGLNPRLAESIGVNVFRYRLMAFTLASAIAGVMGCFYAHYEGLILPDTFGMWGNIYVQLYAILGGISYTILGPLIGSAVMTILPELLRIANVIQPIITGSILILVILFLPDGLTGLTKYAGVISGWRHIPVVKLIGSYFHTLGSTGEKNDTSR